MYRCNNCQQVYSRRDNLLRHAKRCGEMEQKIECKMCTKKFTRDDGLTQHIKRFHSSIQLCEACGIQFSDGIQFMQHKHDYEDDTDEEPPRKKIKILVNENQQQNSTLRCLLCEEDFSTRKKFVGHLRSQKHITASLKPFNQNVTEVCTSFKCRVASYRIQGSGIDINLFLNDSKETVQSIVNTILRSYNSGVKFNLELFSHYTNEKNLIGELKSFNTKMKEISPSMNYFSNIYDEMSSDIKTKCDEFETRDSGWSLKEISHLEININKYKPIRGSSYIELSKKVKDKKACINVQNNDEYCFLWAVVSALHPVKKDSNRISSYPHYSNVLRYNGISFPMKLNDISKFELMNNISVNVYSLEYNSKSENHDVVGPIYHTNKAKETHVNLLYIEEYTKAHYVWIKDFSRLVRSQVSSHEAKKFLCDGCLTFFSTKSTFEQHKSFDCNKICTKLPTKDIITDKNGDQIPGNILKFQNYERKMRVPFVVYADFESYQEPISSCSLDPNISNTNKTHIHVPYSFAYNIKCSFDDSLSKFETYTGEDCPKVFIEMLCSDMKRIYNDHLKIVQPMSKLTPDEKYIFNSSTTCHICNKLLDFDDKVADHDHLTSKFVGAAHSKCNLNYKIPKMIPIYFHNLSNYDSHLFIKEFGSDKENIDIIPENKEKYISFTKYLCVDEYINKFNITNKIHLKLRFLDSLRFMNSSLEKLAKNLKDDQCREVRKYFPDDNQFKLLRRKGVFPYSYMDSIDRLTELSLPTKQSFNDLLNNHNCSETEYTQAKNVWQTFHCRNLKEYSDLYLKTDVLLLTDVFEQFRNVCIATYQLDPAHYFTAPGLTWDAMLKMTGIELELFTDVDMHHFVQKGIRGGICQASLRYVKANNKYMSEYNQNNPNTFLTYWDANNLYGWALSQLIPYGGFTWLNEEEILKFDVSQIDDDSPIGYFIEADIEYPKSLHHLHNDLPFLVENMTPPKSKFKNNKKLIPNLYDKTKYVIHYRNLKQAIKHGLKIKKIHRIIQFKQSNWLKQYVDTNTRLRQAAKDDFEKDFFKLMNNAVFGKTLENLDKRVDVKLVNHWKNIGRKPGAESLLAKPNMKNVSIFTENLIAIQFEKLKILYNKPIYVGFAVLELSKFLMYDFFYDFLKPKYGDNITLCYCDTDSFILLIETEDIYQDILKNNDKFDTSNFNSDNVYKIPLKNKSVLGLFKDELAGKLMSEFIALRPKMYAYCTEEDQKNWVKKAKGIKKCVVNKNLTGDDYKNSLFCNDIIYQKQYIFRSYKHVIHTVEQNKITLTNNDDKRFICSDNCSTLAWGHLLITEPELSG